MYAPTSPTARAARATLRAILRLRGTPHENPELEHLASVADTLAIADELNREGTLSHTRASRVVPGRISVYRREPASPTGVVHAVDGPACPELIDGLRAIRASAAPLSPTEPR